MLRSLTLATIAFSLTAPPVLAAEKPPVALKRVSKREMQYNEDSCSLVSRFGEGDNSVLMILTRHSPTDSLEMKLYGKMLKHGGISLPIEIAFGDQAPAKREGMYATSTSTESKAVKEMPTAIVPGLRVDGWRYPTKPAGEVVAPAITPQQEDAVKSISFKVPGSKRHQLLTGSLGAPLAAMRKCTDDLLRHWGFDPAVQSTLSRSAVPTANPGTWLGTSDFPTKATYEGMNGFVRFRLDVDESGNVAGCRVLFRTNPDEFAALSCKLISKRAKFTPALDVAGKPVKSYYISQIRWQSGEW